jgi:hypothetical protein
MAEDVDGFVLGRGASEVVFYDGHFLCDVEYCVCTIYYMGYEMFFISFFMRLTPRGYGSYCFL